MQYHVVFEELGEKMIAVVVNDEKDLENLVLHYDKELFKLCYVERISDEFKQNWIIITYLHSLFYGPPLPLSILFKASSIPRSFLAVLHCSCDDGVNPSFPQVDGKWST